MIERFDNRLDQVEERISKLEDRAVEVILSEEQNEKRREKHEGSIRDSGYHQVDQCIMYYSGPRRRRERWGKETYLKK